MNALSMPVSSLFEPTDHTAAARRVAIRRIVHASPEAVFAVLERQDELSAWVPLLSHVEAPAACEVGAERVCTFGGDELHETIVHWDPPRLLAYRARDTADATDHLAVVRAQPAGDGRTEVVWEQYFTPAHAWKGAAMALLMRVVLGRALANLARRVEGGAR